MAQRPVPSGKASVVASLALHACQPTLLIDLFTDHTSLSLNFLICKMGMLAFTSGEGLNITNFVERSAQSLDRH